MMRWRGDAVLSLVLCSCLLSCCSCYSANGAALQAEVEIVALFFEATGFRNTTAVTMEILCSGWPKMISCDSARVESLNFGSVNLVGTLPSGLHGLSFLRSVIVSRNQLSGSIPSNLGQ